MHKTQWTITILSTLQSSVNQNSRLDGDKVRSITNQGQVGKYNHEYLGFNFRLAEPLCLQAYHNMKLHMKGIKAELGMRN